MICLESVSYTHLFSTCLQGIFYGVLDTAAARNLHADNGHAFDIVVTDDFGQLFGVVAVSYTHLDVYKRQVQHMDSHFRTGDGFRLCDEQHSSL